MTELKQKSPNHAHIKIASQQRSGEDFIRPHNKLIGNLSANYKPGAKFDLVIKDVGGNEIFRERVDNPTGRWGRRIDKELSDSQYKVEAENVEGTEEIDIFAN